MTVELNERWVDELWARQPESFSGRWIEAARRQMRAGNLLEAVYAWEKARDGYGRGSPEWACLDAWREHVRRQALQAAPALAYLRPGAGLEAELGLAAPAGIPVPTQRMDRADGVEWSAMLEGVRWHLLAHPDEESEWRGLASRLALQAGIWEGAQGDIDLADHYFGLAKGYAGWSVDMLMAVGFGYLRSGDYDSARRELGEACADLARAGELDAEVWLNLAQLNFYLGSRARGRHVLWDYLARAARLGPRAEDELVAYAFAWARRERADDEVGKILREYVG